MPDYFDICDHGLDQFEHPTDIEWCEMFNFDVRQLCGLPPKNVMFGVEPLLLRFHKATKPLLVQSFEDGEERKRKQRAERLERVELLRQAVEKYEVKVGREIRHPELEKNDVDTCSLIPPPKYLII